MSVHVGGKTSVGQSFETVARGALADELRQAFGRSIVTEHWATNKQSFRIRVANTD
jgi:hypothetical protein